MSGISKDPRLYYVHSSKSENVSCPYCGAQLNKGLIYAEDYYLPPFNGDISSKRNSKQVCFTFFACPSCEKESILAKRSSGESFTSMVHPRFSQMALPDYVPQAIRSDYVEACAVAEISPKAAATLCRRCIQGMIHDVWNIHEKNLNAEITSLKPLISTATWQAIDSLRQIGNIGAHMEHDASLIVDIEPGEASALIRLIEYLIFDWYIRKHEEEVIFNSVNSLNQQYQSRRNR